MAGSRTRLPPYQLVEVAAGVYAYLQPDGGWCLNNAGILVSQGESALVDTAATQARAQRLRRVACDLAGVAPRAVINTHFHGDHTFGNGAFPEALIIGHEHTRTAMRDAGLYLTTMWPEVEWGEITLVPPSLTYRDRLTLYLGELQVELIHIGPSHTTGDTVVWLPEQRVLFTGDIVMTGVTPFCVMGSVSGSLVALEQLRALGAETVVAGHGPVSGPETFDLSAEYLRWLQRLAAAGVADGLSPIEAARAADLGEYAALIDAERLAPNLHRAYAEQWGAAPGAPLDMAAALRDLADYHGRMPTCHA